MNKCRHWRGFRKTRIRRFRNEGLCKQEHSNVEKKRCFLPLPSVRCWHGWLHTWDSSEQVLWPLHWQSGHLVKNHCCAGQVQSVLTLCTLAKGPPKPPGRHVPVPLFEPSSHHPQAGSSYDTLQWNLCDPKQCTSKYLAFSAASVRFASGHFHINTCTHRGVSFLASIFFGNRNIRFPAFALVSSPFCTKPVWKRGYVGVLIYTTILVRAPQAISLQENSLCKWMVCTANIQALTWVQFLQEFLILQGKSQTWSSLASPFSVLFTICRINNACNICENWYGSCFW